MILKVQIGKIKPNPFQMRKTYNYETIKGLAEEIKNFGLWKGSLRGRKVDGNNVELCSGHRRLEAIKLLGWKEVEVEIVKLDDDQMMAQSLIENLQREDLSDIEKAHGIQYMINRLQKNGMDKEEAFNKTCEIMGLSKSWVSNLLKLLKMEPEVKKAIKQKKIAGRTAMEAYQFGGKKMVKTAIKHKLGVHAISQISQKVRKVQSEKVQKQIKKEIIEGKAETLEDVETRVVTLLNREPEENVDVSNQINDWAVKLSKLNEELQILVKLRDLIKKHPLQLAHLKVVIRKLIQDLNSLL
ncbi:MAG: ParB/RepB/Spo0J family partition protein [Planctomycetes bacterium]|nr:ParB/RepB/Spo0J family partition protein [Planctomycetota bacterium]